MKETQRIIQSFFFHPTRTRANTLFLKKSGGIAQLVERQLCKLDVWGSNPHASTNFLLIDDRLSADLKDNLGL